MTLSTERAGHITSAKIYDHFQQRFEQYKVSLNGDRQTWIDTIDKDQRVAIKYLNGREYTFNKQPQRYKTSEARQESIDKIPNEINAKIAANKAQPPPKNQTILKAEKHNEISDSEPQKTEENNQQQRSGLELERLITGAKAAFRRDKRMREETDPQKRKYMQSANTMQIASRLQKVLGDDAGMEKFKELQKEVQQEKQKPEEKEEENIYENTERTVHFADTGPAYHDIKMHEHEKENLQALDKEIEAYQKNEPRISDDEMKAEARAVNKELGVIKEEKTILKEKKTILQKLAAPFVAIFNNIKNFLTNLIGATQKKQDLERTDKNQSTSIEEEVARDPEQKKPENVQDHPYSTVQKKPRTSQTPQGAQYQYMDSRDLNLERSTEANMSDEPPTIYSEPTRTILKEKLYENLDGFGNPLEQDEGYESVDEQHIYENANRYDESLKKQDAMGIKQAGNELANGGAEISGDAQQDATHVSSLQDQGKSNNVIIR
jgi:plasmid maintenance system antidote protein VapI